MTMWHELERVFILGDFRLVPAEVGFCIVADRPLQLGSWAKQGNPLYGDAVTYTQRFDLSSTGGKYVVRLPQWYGSVAQVLVNGAPAGVIGHQPWECEVTSLLKRGNNTIAVKVTGTLKNTLGPHHNSPPLGIASPWSFRNGAKSGVAPGEEYSVIDYGLFQPFVLEKM